MSTTDTLSRRLALLALLPRYPGETTAAELHRRLLGRGYEVDLRTVQRDLHHLSNGQQLTCDESQHPYRWSLTADAPLNLANLDTPTALALNLAERHLEALLPHSVLEQLRPHFAHARRHLDGLQQNGLAHWARRVRSLPNGKALLPAEVEPDVWQTVSGALMERRQLQVDYLSRSKGEIKTLRLHPAGIVSRHAITYLIGTANDYDDLRQFALHRIQRAELMDEPAREHTDFDIDGYIAGGAFGGGKSEGEVELVADVSPRIAWLLKETPLSARQRIEPLPDTDWERLYAWIPMDQETLWWVFGLGENVRVREPESWTGAITERVSRLRSLYEQGKAAHLTASPE
jgi:predicted DNA-binding transcriptional regulator YafY